jgi:hypothetical protein
VATDLFDALFEVTAALARVASGVRQDTPLVDPTFLLPGREFR